MDRRPVGKLPESCICVARAERSTEYIARSASGQTAETGILSIKGQPVHNVVHLEASSALTEVEIVERHDRLDRELFDADPLNLRILIVCITQSEYIYSYIRSTQLIARKQYSISDNYHGTVPGI